MRMKEKDVQPPFNSGEKINKSLKDLYGLDPEMSLQSVNFAPNENSLLNEHYQEDSNENE